MSFIPCPGHPGRADQGNQSLGGVNGHRWDAGALSTLELLFLHLECFFLASVGLSDLSFRCHLLWEVVHESQLPATTQVWPWLSRISDTCPFSLGTAHILSCWFLLIFG